MEKQEEMNKKKGKSTNMSALYMVIDSDLKKEFSIKCIENGTSMTNTLISFVKEYVSK